MQRQPCRSRCCAQPGAQAADAQRGQGAEVVGRDRVQAIRSVSWREKSASVSTHGVERAPGPSAEARGRGATWPRLRRRQRRQPEQAEQLRPVRCSA